MSEGNEEDLDNFKVVSNMLKRAKDVCLEVEVVTYFALGIKNGMTISEAAYEALYEWDA